MNGILFTAVIIAMIATLGALFLGIFSMAKGGEFAQRNSNRFMRWRVALQALAILLFVVLILAMRG